MVHSLAETKKPWSGLRIHLRNRNSIHPDCAVSPSHKQHSKIALMVTVDLQTEQPFRISCNVHWQFASCSYGCVGVAKKWRLSGHFPCQAIGATPLRSLRGLGPAVPFRESLHIISRRHSTFLEVPRRNRILGSGEAQTLASPATWRRPRRRWDGWRGRTLRWQLGNRLLRLRSMGWPAGRWRRRCNSIGGEAAGVGIGIPWIIKHHTVRGAPVGAGTAAVSGSAVGQQARREQQHGS